MCKHCGHSEKDHHGYWLNKETGKWDIEIPGYLCFYEENIGHQEDFCVCPGYEENNDSNTLCKGL